MALLDHVDQIKFTTRLPSDIILGTFTGSLASPDPGTSMFGATRTTSTKIIPTGINEKTFFQGIFSIDGGVTWCDFNSNRTLTLGLIVNLQTQMMYGKSTAGSLTLYADNWSSTSDRVNYSGAAYTFMYKVVLFARPDQGDITAQPVTQSRNFSTTYNYQKIWGQSIYNFSFPVAVGVATLAHGLGYAPQMRIYVDNFSPAGDNALYDFGYWISQYVKYQVYADTNNIYIRVDNSAGVAPITGTMYLRVYYEDA